MSAACKVDVTREPNIWRNSEYGSTILVHIKRWHKVLRQRVSKAARQLGNRAWGIKEKILVSKWVNGDKRNPCFSHTHKRLCTVIYLESSHKIYMVYRVQFNVVIFFYWLRQGTYRIEYIIHKERDVIGLTLLASIRSCIHTISMKKNGAIVL